MKANVSDGTISLRGEESEIRMIELKEEFAARLEKALNHRQMKPVDLARSTGISEATISQYRSGYAKPKEKKLVLLANALRVDPSWLMGMDVPMYTQQTLGPNSGDMSDGRNLYYQEIIPIIKSLSDENLHRLIRYAEKLHDIQIAEDELK